MRSTVLALPLLLFACNGPSANGTTLSAEAFSARIGGGVQLIDVRTAGESAVGHIPQAVNLDWTGGQLESNTNKLDKGRPVLLYCASGRRSADAKAHLRSRGFTDVVDLDGGINAWRSAGMPVEP